MHMTEILLVEDSPGDVGLVQESLAILRPRFRITAVGTIPSALRYLGKLPPYSAAATPQLIIIDLNLPMGSGFDLLTAVRSDARTAGIRCIVFSSSKRQVDQDRAIALGALAYFHKPLVYEDFCDCVLRMVQQSLHAEE